MDVRANLDVSIEFLKLMKNKLRYNIVEVKQKLEEYIDHTSQLLNQTVRAAPIDIESIVTKVNTCKDREIARIRQYYDKVMDALALERDNYISQIVSISEDNIENLLSSNGTAKSKKSSKNDMKLKNFGIELGKVLEGVDETGIHIKELWKINQDYNDVVSNKHNEISNVHENKENSYLRICEFQIANESELKALASKVGQIQVKEIPLTEFNCEESSKPKSTQSYHKHHNSRSGYNFNNYESKFESKIEHVPTFGMNNLDNVNRHNDHKSIHDHEYGKYKQNKVAQSFSPARPLNYAYNPSGTGIYQKEQSKLQSFKSNEEEGEHQQYNLGRKTYKCWRKDQPISNDKRDRPIIYEKYVGQPDTAEYKRRDTKEIRNKAERPNSKDYDIQNIEEIKKKYTQARHEEPNTAKFNEAKADFRKEFERIHINKVMPESHKIASFYNEAKVKIRKDDYTENDYNEVEDEINKMKIKLKGEKENVIKESKRRIK